MLLAIDTATRVLSLALHDGKQVRAETTWTTRNQHTTELMPAIRQLLDRSQVDLTDLTILAVSQGPGSFNGLRIGISAAKGLAMALKLPLLAIPTLDVIAVAQPGPAQDGTLIAVVQAGRGRVCAGSYRWRTGRWTSQDDVKIVSWRTVVENLLENGSETVISGEIDAEGRAAVMQAVQAAEKSIRMASPAHSLRRAGFLAELAWERWRDASRDPQMGDAAAVVPIYLHQPGVPHP